jgi:hypothetical protein
VPQSIRGICCCPKAAGRTPSSAWLNGETAAARGTSYDRLSAEAAAILKIEDHLPNLEIDQLAEVMTFLVVEKRIASSLRERVRRPPRRSTPTMCGRLPLADNRALGFAAVAGSHRCPTPGPSMPFTMHSWRPRISMRCGISTRAASTIPTLGDVRAYESELYRFDQLYRHFCESADIAEEQGWSILKPLRADIELTTSTGI